MRDEKSVVMYSHVHTCMNESNDGKMLTNKKKINQRTQTSQNANLDKKYVSR